jgi:WS/DGAT/MGAT family acyltransferase
MTDAEALMWVVEREPGLRSSFSNVTFLERLPDLARFRRRMLAAVAQIPRLRQRVVGMPGGLGPPAWVDDASFDLDYHVRHLGLPAPGTRRQLLDLASVLHEEAFDPDRPLWQFTIVEGLEGGEAALLAKMHHTISDGVGAIRLSAMFIDAEPDPEEPSEPATVPSGPPTSWLDIASSALRRPVDLGRLAMGAAAGAVSNPAGALGTAVAVARQAIVTDPARSPLWERRRSTTRRFETLTAELEPALRASKLLGGTFNDFYVTALAAAAGAYHRQMGTPVDELRATMPVSTRTDRSAGGNSFVPTRLLVPTAEEDPVRRFAVVHDRLTMVKRDPTLGAVDGVAAVAALLPAPLVRRIARSQVGTVDFAASNVRGAPFDLFIGGAPILANHPFGPTGGTAFNATVMSYRSSMDIGINCDAAAIDEPDRLRRCLADAIEELITAAG